MQENATHPVASATQTDQLKLEILNLESELQTVKDKISGIEAKLRSHLIEEIIEEQELYILYKQKQKAKKEIRREQQRKGKNFKETTLPLHKKPIKSAPAIDDAILRKKLYREAMVMVHPDKYAAHEETSNLASDATVKLIDIYQNGSIEDLQHFHAYILSGMALDITDRMEDARKTDIDPVQYLHSCINKLKQEIEATKSKHTYRIISQYPDIMEYVALLKEFYADRINKLRKRTRKMPTQTL